MTAADLALAREMGVVTLKPRDLERVEHMREAGRIVAQALAAELPGRIIYEDYAGNTFLPQAAMGNADAQLPAQLYYLTSRVKQLSRLTWPADGTMVSDYAFCQDRMYAEAQLCEDDLRLYVRVARRLEALVQPPDLLIHLDAEPAALLERIAQRGREFEKALTEAFLVRMRGAYNTLEQVVPCEVIRVDSQQIDLRDSDARAALVEQVREKL